MVGILAGTIEDAFIVLVFFLFYVFLLQLERVLMEKKFDDLNMQFSYAAISSKLPSHQNTMLVSACLESL